MIVAEHSVYTSPLCIESIWMLYSEVNAWKEWDKDIVYSYMTDGEFENGGKGELQTKDGHKVVFYLSNVIPQKSFTVISHLPGAKMYFHHIIKKRNHDYVEIMHRVEIVGWTSLFFCFLLRSQLQKVLSRALFSLMVMAEKMEKKRKQ